LDLAASHRRSMRQIVREARVALRMPTSAGRALPHFLVIGAQRCGTTSLYNYLGQHPGVARPLGKELQFFSTHFQRGVPWYRAHFPAAQTGSGVLTFEATPYYLFHPQAARRAASVVPGARMIVLVRNPVDRAWSHHRHSSRLGIEHLCFEEALAQEPERLRGEAERLLAEPDYASPRHRAFSYAARGRYAEQLEEWYRHFPPDRIMVVRSEDLYREPRPTYRGVLEFLELSAWAPPEFPVFTRSRADAAGMDPDTRCRLREEFEPHNRRLATLLDIDLGWD